MNYSLNCLRPCWLWHYKGSAGPSHHLSATHSVSRISEGPRQSHNKYTGLPWIFPAAYGSVHHTRQDILLCTALPSHSLPQCSFTASAMAFFLRESLFSCIMHWDHFKRELEISGSGLCEWKEPLGWLKWGTWCFGVSRECKMCKGRVVNYVSGPYHTLWQYFIFSEVHL